MSDADGPRRPSRGRPRKDPDGLHNYPSIRLMESVLRRYKTLSGSQGGARTISGLDGPSSFYKDLNRLEEFLGRPVLTRVPGHGTFATDEQVLLLREIEEIVERVKGLLGESKRVRLRLATSGLLSIRVAGRLIDSFLARYPAAERPEVETVLGSPNSLAAMAGTNNPNDLILTFATRGWEFDPGLILGDVKAHRCILVRRHHPFAKEFKSRIESGEFEFKMLRGLSVAMVADDRRLPDFGKADVERYARVVATSSTLESHAHVRSSIVDLTFTHKDILSEGDLKNLCAIDLARVGDESLQGTRLCLLRGGRRVIGKDAEQKLGVLTDVLLTYFDEFRERYEAAEQLETLLQERFPYTYHTSFLPDEATRARSPRSTWVRGKVDWEVNVPPAAPGSEGGDVEFHLGGTQRFLGPDDMPQSLLFFGRVVKLDSAHRSAEDRGEVRHIWRSFFFEDETAVFNVVLNILDLLSQDYLFGNWFGTPTWVDNREIQIGGCVIFLPDGDLREPQRLNEIVRLERARVDRYYGKGTNPQDPWKTPPSIHGGSLENL